MKIQFAKPFLPPRGDYTDSISDIWNSYWLTNNGVKVQSLEKKLKAYLNIKNLVYTSNGTIALQMAIKALDIPNSEIITTPFSYIATSSSIAWENCQPKFVDIDPVSLNINPLLIEENITENTKAILATHVFGNPCDIDRIAIIAHKYKLKVIYDAAHCFGVSYKNKSVFSYGHIATTSFHATKLFHTIEGGAVFSGDLKLVEKLQQLRNFGHNGPHKFAEIGINGKNSEFHAAMGLCNLDYIDIILRKREIQHKYYLEQLKSEKMTFQSVEDKTKYNYSYFPVIFDSEEVLLNVNKSLNSKKVFPRRYFYPSLNKLGIFNNSDSCPISEAISSKILCLPLFHDLSQTQQDIIVKIILKEL